MVWKYAGRYVLPFSPSNMKMDIRWNTALADTISSVRTRSLSKEYPQFTVKYSTLLKGAGLQFATDRVLRDLDQEVLVPMWQDVATERISDTEVAVLTDKTFYREGMLVILWASDTEWQIVEVEQVNPNYVKFGVNSTDWKCVAPIEEGFMAASPSTSTDRNRNTKLDYSVVIKRLDGPLSTTGGGVIPGVYVKSFIGNGVDSGLDKVHGISSFENIAFSFDLDFVLPTGDFNILMVIGNEILPDAYFNVALLSWSDGRIGIAVLDFYGNVTGELNLQLTAPVGTCSTGNTYKIDCNINVMDFTGSLSIDEVVVVPVVAVLDSPTIPEPIVITNPILNIMYGRQRDSESYSYVVGEIYELYISTNILAVDRTTIIQYATGQEHFTQIAPDVVPEVYDSFVGDGVSSYIYRPNIDSQKDIFSVMATIDIEQMTGDGAITSIKYSNETSTFLDFRIDSNNRVKVYTANEVFEKGFYTVNSLTVGVVHNVLVKLNKSGGFFEVYIDDVPQTLFEYYTANPLPPRVGVLDLTIGAYNQGINRFYKGDIAELYWSDNPLVVSKATMLQYATGEEHFTQVAPDALPSSWYGGAVQGEIKEGWLGGAVQGTIEISPPSGGPPGPYPEDPKLTRTPIQSTKANNYSLHLNTVKSVGGVIKVNSMRSVPTVTTTHTWDNQNRSEYLDMLDFAARCRGRKNAFDTASFKCDLIPITEGAIGNGYLDVLDPGLQSLTLQGTRFTVIRGSSWDSSEVYEILSLENVTGGVRLILDKAIAVTIFTTDAVSNIRQSRLNSDVLEINIDSFTKSSASVSVRDINEGG